MRHRRRRDQRKECNEEPEKHQQGNPLSPENRQVELRVRGAVGVVVMNRRLVLLTGVMLVIRRLRRGILLRVHEIVHALHGATAESEKAKCENDGRETVQAGGTILS